jgi:hypothetical protein
VEWSVACCRRLAVDRLSGLAIAGRTCNPLRWVPSGHGTLEHLRNGRLAAWLHDLVTTSRWRPRAFTRLTERRSRQLRGAPRDLVSLVAYHSGAVFEAERRGLADELAAIDPPPQPVLDALTFVDVTT